jgi:hypothetical protein
MAKRPAPPSATEEEVRALLERYRCPVPFHEVRTRFLGNVATPLMSASFGQNPIQLLIAEPTIRYDQDFDVRRQRLGKL